MRKIANIGNNFHTSTRTGRVQKPGKILLHSLSLLFLSPFIDTNSFWSFLGGREERGEREREERGRRERERERGERERCDPVFPWTPPSSSSYFSERHFCVPPKKLRPSNNVWERADMHTTQGGLKVAALTLSQSKSNSSKNHQL